MRISRRAAAIALATILPLVTCTTEKLSLGAGCDRNSDCDTPLVCRIERCRNECNTTRDCPAGLLCVKDADGIGACQLEREKTCALDSDCDAPLVCRATQCTNECREDRDCSPGATCESGGCIDLADKACTSHHECNRAGEGLVCARDLRCRVECIDNRDCRYGSLCCSDSTCHEDCGGIAPRDAGPRMDGSTPSDDAGPRDGGSDPGPCDPSVGSDPVVDVAVGPTYACALLTSGRVYCWGAWERLGRGDLGLVPGDSRDPGPVEGLDDAIAIETENGAVCAVRATGGVVCWGNTFFDDPDALSPIAIDGLADVTRVSLWRDSACALTSSGALCWGQPALGDGTSDASRDPVAVLEGATATSLSGGGDHGLACMVLADGTTRCWGTGISGLRPGDGTATASLLTPTPSTLTDPVTQIAATPSLVCALGADGSVWCWGAPSLVGDGSTMEQRSPVQVIASGATSVSVGATGACATFDDEHVECWGADHYFADGNDPHDETSPIEIPNLRGATRIALDRSASSPSACAVVDGRAVCWGSPAFRKLGTCSTTTAYIPVDVLGLP